MVASKNAPKQKSAEEKKPKTKPRTKADDIWDMIRGLPLDLYSLPGQTLEGHVNRLDVVPEQVHLQLKSTAVLPAMEEAMKGVKLPEGKSFRVDQQTGYVTVEIVVEVPAASSLT
jgi:hypothetical protein